MLPLYSTVQARCFGHLSQLGSIIKELGVAKLKGTKAYVVFFLNTYVFFWFLLKEHKTSIDDGFKPVT